MREDNLVWEKVIVVRSNKIYTSVESHAVGMAFKDENDDIKNKFRYNVDVFKLDRVKVCRYIIGDSVICQVLVLIYMILNG